MPEQYDFIVCGAGSAGSVVAARLSENSAVKVLLIEASGNDDVPEVMTPGKWSMNLGSERDWAFVAQPNPHLNGRSIPLNMGKVLGGGSSINVMVWARGHKNDWEHFAEVSGDPKWGYESVLDVYRRIENWQGAADPTRRGTGGPVYIEPSSSPAPVALAMVEAANLLGITSFDSPNGEMMEGRGGVAISDLIVKGGQRSSIYRSYVYPHLNRKNLTVMSGTLVSKLIISGSSVLGVEVIKDSVPKTLLAAKEVILSLGAVHTPKVLMQSGIGPKDELAKHGIGVVQHLPGVGRNHQDHIALSCVFAFREPQEMRNGGSEAALYWKTDPGLRQPDIFHCQAEFPVASAEVAKRGLPSHGWSMFAGISHPKSRGVVRLSGPNVNDPVLIDANTLSHPDDVETALKTIELSQEISDSAPLAPFVAHEVFPGKLSRKDMEQYARDAAITYWHQAGTAKMGRDEFSVVDSSLKVYGIERLRIADTSVMPEITTGNTMAPCVVIGERIAEMIKSSNGL